MNQPPPMPLGRRLTLLLIAWCVAVLAAAAAFPHLSRKYILLFPYGLFTAVISALGAKGNSAPHVAVGWLMYVVLTFTSLFSARRMLYFTLYAILCGLLLLNIIGCHMMFHGYPKS
jgi:hypothetical protein